MDYSNRMTSLCGICWRHTLILIEIRVWLTVILILLKVRIIFVITVKRCAAVAAIEHFFRIFRSAALAKNYTVFSVLLCLLFGLFKLFFFKRKISTVFVCKMTMTFFFITFSVMRCAAFRADYNIVTLFELFVTYRTFVFCKFHYKPPKNTRYSVPLHFNYNK